MNNKIPIIAPLGLGKNNKHIILMVILQQALLQKNLNQED